MSNAEYEVYRVAIRSKSLFKTISFKQVIDIFKAAGYTAKVTPPPISPVSDEYSFRVSMPVLQKGEIAIDLNTEMNSIGIIGNNLELLIDEIEDIFIPKVSEMTAFQRNIWFYEVQIKIKFKDKENSAFTNIGKTEIKRTYGLVEGIDDKMKLQGITLWNNTNPDTENFTEVKVTTDIHSPELVIYQIILRRQKELEFLEAIRKIKQNLSSYFNS
jgi:hypothetical protein